MGANAGCHLLRPRPQLPAVIVPQPPILFPASLYTVAPMPLPAVLTPELTTALPTFPLDRIGPPPHLRRRADSIREPRPEPFEPPPASAAPLTAPQLTTPGNPVQQAASRRHTTGVLSQARNELRLLYSRRLDRQAAATRAQASEYVRQAEAALAQGDLVRAQMLAQKAEQLARFLLGQ